MSRDLDQAVFQYDLFRTDYNPEWKRSDDPVLSLLDKSEEIVFLTLWSPVEVLKARKKQRERPIVLRLLKMGQFRRAVREYFAMQWVRNRVMTPENVALHYRDWFEFSRNYPAKAHWVWNTSVEPVKLIPLDEWFEERKI